MSSATSVRPLAGGMLWYFTFGSSRNVSVNPSGDTSHDFASSGFSSTWYFGVFGPAT